MTAPLTPEDCDLRDFSRMMIDISRLRQSGFDAILDDTAWRAGMNLWFSAWHAVPAGSLQDNDGVLAKAAGLGRDLRTWEQVKEDALRGFVLCDDGRLYHETVSEFVLEAWIEKLLQRISSGSGNAKRWDMEFDPTPIEEAIKDAADRLSRIAPHSKAITKARRKRGPKQSQVDPTGNPENPTGTDAHSHRKEISVPPRSLEKGTEKGTENNILESFDRPAEPAVDQKPTRLDDHDLKSLYDAVIEASGLLAATPRVIDSAYNYIEDWRSRGYDFENVVIPTIRRVVANSSDPTSSLKRFEKLLSHEHAKAGSAKATGAKYRAPVSPIITFDGETEPMRRLRQDLVLELGPSVYVTYAHNARLEPVEESHALRVRCSGPHELNDGDRRPIIARVAKKHGFKEVW